MNFERAYRRLIEKDLETDRLYISFRDKEKRWFGFDTKFARLTNSKTFLIQQMKQLFEKTHNANILYRSTGVTFTGLEPALPKQFTLEEVGSIQILENQKDLEKIINEINKKYGRMTVTRGGSGSVDPRYMERFQKKKLKKTGAARVRRVRGMRIQ